MHKETEEGRLQWHPAFGAALRIELEEELDGLVIQDEYLLGRKPMQIDVLIIKKEKGRNAGDRYILYIG